jgi:hypothetical protein
MWSTLLRAAQAKAIASLQERVKERGFKPSMQPAAATQPTKR